MKFKLQIKDLNAALDVVSIVTPAQVQGAQGGFLFVLRGDRCFIYSRDAQQQARVDLSVEDLQGEGSFVFPSDKVGALKFRDGWIEIESGHDKEDDRFWVRYRAEGGASADRATIDPRLMQSIDDALEKSKEVATYPAALLREGINITRSFLAKPADGADDNFKGLQIFDAQEKWAKGNGHLFAADSIRACFFFCDAFLDKGLNIHGQHLGQITAFLAKCQGDITVRTGEGATFAINSKGQVLGWAHQVKQHNKFNYYPYEWDKFILKAPKELLVKELRYIRAGLDAKRDKIRVSYSHTEKQLTFSTSEGTGKDASMPVGVVPITDMDGDAVKAGGFGATEDFAANVNLNHLLETIEPMKAQEADIRVAPIPAKDGRKEAYLFRTIERFWLDANGKLLIAPGDAAQAYECRVTRFMPSRE